MKNILVTVLFLLCTLPAFALQILDFPSFVHLPPNKQRDTVVLLQKLAVHMEGQNQVIDNKTVENKQYILNFLINSAWASEAIDKDLDQLCIFGGWISFMNAQTNKCSHPSQIPNFLKSKQKLLTPSVYEKLFTESVNYTNSLKATNCKAPNILCNPKLFGQDPTTNKAFCVKGSQDADNTSFACYNSVKDHEQTEQILDGVVQAALKDGTGQFTEFMYMLYDLCMCKGKSGLINESYAERIWAHRTCYGLIKQSQKLFDHMNNNYGSCQKLRSKDYSMAGAPEVSSFLDFSSEASKAIYDDVQYDEMFTEADKKDSDFMQLRIEQYNNSKGICPLEFKPQIKLTATNETETQMTIQAKLVGVFASGVNKDFNWTLDPQAEKEPNEKDGSITIKKTDKPIKVTASKPGTLPGSREIPPLKKDIVISIQFINDKSPWIIELNQENISNFDPVNIKWVARDGETPLEIDFIPVEGQPTQISVAGRLEAFNIVAQYEENSSNSLPIPAKELELKIELKDIWMIIKSFKLHQVMRNS